MTELTDARAGGWLRRNLIPLVIATLSAIGCGVVLIVLPLVDQASREPMLVVVPFGESVASGGYEWKLDASAKFPGTGIEENGIPTGMALVGARIEVRPLDDAAPELYCKAELTSRTTGVERSWAQVVSPAQFRYEFGEQSESNCYPEGEAIEYEIVFITPEGSYDGATVDLSVSGDDVEVFRLELAP